MYTHLDTNVVLFDICEGEAWKSLYERGHG